MTNLEHNRLLAIFLYIQGGLQIFGGIMAALIYGGMGAFFAVSATNEAEAAFVASFMIVLGVIVVLLTMAFGGFYLYAARKVQLTASSGRTLGIVASALCLLNVPLGTALGIYGLWFLTGDKGRELYLGTTEYAPLQPPPPASWQ